MKLTSADFRFLSAWVQGVDVHDAWDRYMRHRGTDDLRRMRSTVRTMLDLLASVSKRYGDAETAALLRRDSTRIKLPALSAGKLTVPVGQTVDLFAPRRMPTLEQFAAELEDASFYSEAELVELLEQRYGKVGSLRPDATRPTRQRDTPELRAEKRRGRLVQRQLDALRRLEFPAATTPAPSDALSGWLDTETVTRLGAVGVLRISELMFYIRLHGYRLYRKVQRIGEGGAVRLVAWLRQHEEALGPVSVTALAPLRQLDVAAITPRVASGVVSIERLRLPSTLSGADGSNRADSERCKARARHDYAAVAEWLELPPPLDAGTATEPGATAAGAPLLVGQAMGAGFGLAQEATADAGQRAAAHLVRSGTGHQHARGGAGHRQGRVVEPGCGREGAAGLEPDRGRQGVEGTRGAADRAHRMAAGGAPGHQGAGAVLGDAGFADATDLGLEGPDSADGCDAGLRAHEGGAACVCRGGRK